MHVCSTFTPFRLSPVEKLRRWSHSMQEVMCVSAGELVCDPSWTLWAQSHWKLTSSITLS